MSVCTLDLPAVVLSAIPALFTVVFLFMFIKDNDKRKLIAGISFAFMSASSAVEVFGLSQPFYILNNLYWWGDLPIICALTLFFLSQMLNQKSFEKPNKIFFAIFAGTFVILAVPGSYAISRVIVDSCGFVALSLSFYLFFRRRRFVDTLFLLSLLSFYVYGYSWGTTVGVVFGLTWYTASFLFVGLAFGYAAVENNWDGASLFKVTKQLDKAKEQLKDLELEYKTIFESANDAIFVIDAQTESIFDCNKGATELLEAKKEEIVGKQEKTLFPVQNEMASTGSSVNHAAGTSEVTELQVVTRRGKVRDVAAKFGSFQNGDKKLLVGVFRDVTEQKRNARDLSLALEYLSNQKDKVEILNEKLKVIGSLTRHDVRNKLMVVNNNLYLLKKRSGNQPELTKYLEGIESAIKQCDKLLEFSRLYEKIGVEEPTEISIADCFNQAVNLIAKSEIEVVNNCQGLTVTADNMLSQLFYNLIDNSQKHGVSVTKITLKYEKDKEKTTLLYEDNGVGIGLENKEKIFSEGYTTGGSGLGLKLVKKMVEAYGWTIQENGVPGEGARFQITIPIANLAGQEQVNLVTNLQADPESKQALRQ